MKLEIRAEGLERVRKVMQRLSDAQMRQAHADALNDAAGHVQRAMRAQIASAFDRPTPWVANSPWVERATPEKLSVAVLPTRRRDGPTRGGKVGVDPQHVLQAQEFGGTRADKKSEAVLRRARILPHGYQTVIPSDSRGGPFPGSADGRGNFTGAFLLKLLSYLQAFSEAGYRSNITDASALRRKDITDLHNIATRRKIRLMDGWEFFVSNGKGSIKVGYTGPHMSGREKVFERDRRQNLQAGIWARKGKELRPVLLFVRRPVYSPRINMDRIAEQSGAGAQAVFERRLRFRLREAAGV